MKVKDNEIVFLDFAFNSFERVMSLMEHERKKAAFEKIKNFYSHLNFENSSKKIFFKIGLATLLLFNQKYEYRGAKWALEKIVDRGRRSRDQKFKGLRI